MTEKDFWIQVRRGLLTVVSAIETRWGLHGASLTTLGATPLNNTEASHHSEPPLHAFAPSSKEGPR